MPQKETAKLRTAIIQKTKSYKFGKSLSKGESVFIKEEFIGKGRYVYTAYKSKNDTIGYGVTKSEFEYTDEEEFIVFVTRTSTSCKNIQVKAKTREEAKKIALEKAGDLEFSEQDAEYSAEMPLTITEHKRIFNT